AHAMHADAAKSFRHRGERADHLVLAGATNLVQRPGTVLAARPGNERLLHFLLRRPLEAVACGQNRRNTASAARSPDSQAPPTVPHRVSWAASPAKEIRLLIGFLIILRARAGLGAGGA